jgi:hypothetical protein
MPVGGKWCFERIIYLKACIGLRLNVCLCSSGGHLGIPVIVLSELLAISVDLYFEPRRFFNDCHSCQFGASRDNADGVRSIVVINYGTLHLDWGWER